MIEKPTGGQKSTTPADSGSYRALLTIPSYRALLAAQFSGSLNDNLYRMVLHQPDRGLESTVPARRISYQEPRKPLHRTGLNS